MINSLLVFVGAGCGGVARYGVSRLSLNLWGTNFPWGTLIVNVTGSLVMGLLSIIILDRYSHLNEVLRPLILVGFLGGYTTFSSFSIESINLMESSQYGAFIGYVLASLLLCIVAAWLGVAIGKDF